MARARPEEMNKGGGAAEACLHLIAIARRFAPRTAPLPEGSFRLAGEVDGEFA